MARITRQLCPGKIPAFAVAISLWMGYSSANAQTSPVQSSAQDLAGALSELARSRNLELLFDQSLVLGKVAGPVGDAASPEQALYQLLSGTDLSYRRTAAGTFVIFRDQAKAAIRPSDAAMAIEEILVVGRRTQNTDIRRTEDDIQPYQVMDSDSITSSQASTVEDFLRTRLSLNTLTFALDQDPLHNAGSTRSQIDLRGLGPDQTLVLVDGRRLPSVPRVLAFTQPDLNGFSPNAIDRIEVLGASTGGIFGIGAAGGAVNIILKRDFEGAEFNAANGISAQGDAWHWGVDGRLSFSNQASGTRVMLRASHFGDHGLEFGDRAFVVEARKLELQLAPDKQESVASPSINFNSIDGTNLVLKDSFGGASLGARTTFLPIDAPPVAQGGAAILIANAGKYDIALSPDGQGTRQSLITPRRTDSLMATIRQEIGPWFEAYLDLLWLQNDGRANYPAATTAQNLLQNRPDNPFRQTVSVSFPTPNLLGQARTLTLTDRASVGFIVRLGGDWSANFDAAIGEARVTDTIFALLDNPPRINPILGQAALAEQLAQFAVVPSQSDKDTTRLNDFNLRLGGPLFQLAGGPLTLTATGEFLQEINTGAAHLNYSSTVGNTLTRIGRTRREVSSIFLEARAPLVAQDSEITLLRGLELQLALRGDRYRLAAPSAVSLFGDSLSPTHVNSRGEIFAGTFGVKVTPIPSLMLRASISTGFTPPTPLQIIKIDLQGSYLLGITDPKRGGPQPLNFSDQFTLSLAGSPSLRPQKTTTFAAGMVMRPDFAPGLRASIDYTELHTSKEITNFALSNWQYFIDNESVYPGRITRAPLSAADAALGYTGGKITAIDTTSLQVGRSVVQAVDFSFDYTRPTDFGVFQAYSQFTWQPSFRRWGDPNKPSYDLVNHPDGPVSIRGNGGVNWSRGDWSSGLNVQFYGPYSGYFATPITAFQQGILGQSDPAGSGLSHIPAQVYLDWTVALRSRLNLIGSEATAIEYRFGIKNLLDAQPPVVTGTFAIQSRNTGVSAYDYNPLGGYGAYGDARGRRFEMAIAIAL